MKIIIRKLIFIISCIYMSLNASYPKLKNFLISSGKIGVPLFCVWQIYDTCLTTKQMLYPNCCRNIINDYEEIHDKKINISNIYGCTDETKIKLENAEVKFLEKDIKNTLSIMDRNIIKYNFFTKLIPSCFFPQYEKQNYYDSMVKTRNLFKEESKEFLTKNNIILNNNQNTKEEK